MARINVGIDPKFLSDQHLIAEAVECTMITGSLVFNGYQIKGDIPEKFTLGKGHVNFFKNKLLYLSLRLSKVNYELDRRGFKVTNKIKLTDFPIEYIWGWNPKMEDSEIVRERIVDRLKNPRKAKSGFHKYYGKPIDNMNEFCDKLLKSKLHFV